MKKFFTLFLLVVLCSLNAAAQEQVMRVTKTNGTTLTIGIDEIDHVDFPEIYNLSLTMPKWSLHPGQQLHLELLITEDGGTCAIDADRWETTDAKVATVDATGAVTAVGAGDATIIAHYESGTAEMQVKVTTEQAFDIQISDITNTACRFSINPADPTMRYYYNMRNVHGNYSIDVMEQHGSVEENLYYFTRDWYQFMADSYADGRSWNEAMQPHLNQGPVSGNYSEFYSMLDPGTEYALYCIGFDAQGYITAPIEMAKFETTAPQPSDNTFEIIIDKCLSTDAMFTINPSNNDQYLVCVQSGPRYVEWFIEHDKIEDMVQPMISQYANDSRYPSLHRGPATVKISDFVTPRSQEDYYVIVFGYDDGQTTPVTLKRLRTESGWTEPEGDIIKVTPPASLVTVDCVFQADDVVEDEDGNVVYDPIAPMAGEIGKVGNDVYMRGFLGKMTDHWMKGTYDASAKTVTFNSPQDMGTFNFYGEGPEQFYVCGGNLQSGEMCPLVFDYDADAHKLRLREGLTFVVNGKPFNWAVHMMLVNMVITTENPLF